jgi:primosomal protein N'
MAKATVCCPHCKAQVTAEVGVDAQCPSCGGALKIHQTGANEMDEQLKRLLGKVKIVERKDSPPSDAKQ